MTIGPINIDLGDDMRNHIEDDDTYNDTRVNVKVDSIDRLHLFFYIIKIVYFIYKVAYKSPFHYYDMAWLFIDYQLDIDVKDTDDTHEH